MDLEKLYERFLQCRTVTTDSRNCPQGSLFIALKGESFNGNAFAFKALEAGCSYAVIDEPEYAVEGDERYLLTDNCLHTLQALANYHRRKLQTPVIGITGTNGKTTTKELISAVMSTQYNTLYTQGNLNNHIGVPLTLLRLTPEHQYAIIEMGASHPGEIKTLVHICEPDYGIITNVGKAHLEGFGSFEGVKNTKKELYDYLQSQGDRPVFIHHDNPYLQEMAQELTHHTAYGESDGLFVHGYAENGPAFLTFHWGKAGEQAQYRIQTRLIGNYNLPNALAAITIGCYFGIPAEKINRALSEYTPANNRSQLKETGSNRLIIDAYNANPTSMMAALKNFSSIKAAHKMLILGDMRELGADSIAEHQKIADYLPSCQADRIILVGEQFQSVRHNYPTCNNVEQLITVLQQDKPSGYTILLKGSNGIHLDRVIDYL